MPVLNRAYFDQWLAGLQQLERPPHRGGEHDFEARVRSVPARHPDHLRRRAEAFEQRDEITVLSHHDRARVSRRKKNLPILRAAQNPSRELQRPTR